MADTREILRKLAKQIRDERKFGANTANRVGSLLLALVDAGANIEDLTDFFIRKDIPNAAQEKITFEKGITVLDLAKLMNLEVMELATMAQAVCQTLRSSKFVDGFSGEGYQIWKDLATGDWNLTIDCITARKVMNIYELIINKVRSVGGMIAVSAGNGKIKTVELIDDKYVLTFEEINTFEKHDLIRCQVFTGKDVKYYWVAVKSVIGDKVLIPVSEFEGVAPVVGDELVLMGNETNKRRQSLIMISATEDGQPRIDVLDGVCSKSFEGCLTARLGNLDGISDSRFPGNEQPRGNGVYSGNCYLSGVFVLANGKDVLTMFKVVEGTIMGEVSTVRKEANKADNYLNNASFGCDMEHWSVGNDIHFFSVDSKFQNFNQNFYSAKNRVAFITEYESRYALRIKISSVMQKNSDFASHPEFDYIQDIEGNVSELKAARMFYISFMYKVTQPGTLTIRFTDVEGGDDFEPFEKIGCTKELTPGTCFERLEIAGKWDGKGDFMMEFDGDMYLYNLALTSRSIDDLYDKFSTKFEQTDHKIQLSAEEIHSNAQKIEEYRGDLTVTAHEIRGELSQTAVDLTNNITEAYEGYVSLTAQGLSSDFTEKINGVSEAFGAFKVTAEQTLSSHSTSIEASNRAIDVANQAISDAQRTADDANRAAGENATALIQTDAAIASIAGRFNADGKLIEGAGFVTESEGNTWWASKNLEDGTTLVSYINQSPEEIKLKAEKIELDGDVIARLIRATGLNINDKFVITKDGIVSAKDCVFDGICAEGFIASKFSTAYDKTSEGYPSTMNYIVKENKDMIFSLPNGDRYLGSILTIYLDVNITSGNSARIGSMDGGGIVTYKGEYALMTCRNKGTVIRLMSIKKNSSGNIEWELINFDNRHFSLARLDASSTNIILDRSRALTPDKSIGNFVEIMSYWDTI